MERSKAAMTVNRREAVRRSNVDMFYWSLCVMDGVSLVLFAIRCNILRQKRNKGLAFFTSTELASLSMNTHTYYVAT